MYDDLRCEPNALDKADSFVWSQTQSVVHAGSTRAQGSMIDSLYHNICFVLTIDLADHYEYPWQMPTSLLLVMPSTAAQTRAFEHAKNDRKPVKDLASAISRREH